MAKRKRAKKKKLRRRSVVSRPQDRPVLGEVLLSEIRRHLESGWCCCELVVRLTTVVVTIAGDLEATAAGECLPWSQKRLEERQAVMEDDFGGSGGSP